MPDEDLRMPVREEITAIKRDVRELRHDMEPLLMLVSLFPVSEWIKSIQKSVTLEGRIDDLERDSLTRGEAKKTREANRQWRIAQIVTGAGVIVTLALELSKHVRLGP